jgi:hypothetical protein
VLTEEELGTAIGARLRAEVTDIQAGHDLLRAVRRRARRSAATRAGLAGLATAAVIGAAGTALAIAPGSHASHRPAAVHDSAGPTIRLDGYLITAPNGTKVHKAGVGYLVTDGKTMFMTLFLERGRVVERVSERIQARGTEPVRVGSMTGWWAGSGHPAGAKAGASSGGELLLRAPGMPSQEFLVVKAAGATQAQVESFAASLAVTKMHAVRVSCVRNCG